LRSSKGSLPARNVFFMNESRSKHFERVNFLWSFAGWNVFFDVPLPAVLFLLFDQMEVTDECVFARCRFPLFHGVSMLAKVAWLVMACEQLENAIVGRIFFELPQALVEHPILQLVGIPRGAFVARPCSLDGLHVGFTK